MDVTPLLDLRPAPRVLFDGLPERADRVRYHEPLQGGSWREVTWAEHARAVREVACWLRGGALQPAERAAVLAPNSVCWMEAALGIQAAGGALVPVYPSNTADQIGYVLAHAEARVVFVDTPALARKLADAWPQVRGTVQHVVWLGDGDPGVVLQCSIGWRDILAHGRQWDAVHPQEFEKGLASLDLADVGLQLYTSGTSGPPKGVPLTHRNVAVNGRDWLVCNAPLVEAGDVDLLWLPMSHVFGFGEACLGNALGFETWLCDPLSVLGLLPKVRPHVFMSVPSVWDKLAAQANAVADPPSQLQQLTGGRLRFCLSGGAGLKREVKDTFLRAGLLIVEGYGLTECAPTLTLNRPSDYRFDSVGKPLPSVDLKLDADGEILARGDNVFAGYWRDDAATRACFTDDGWFRTGDVGRWTEDGFLQIVDRKKDILVTSGGKNVAPANVELKFALDPLIAHAVVYGDGKSYLVAGFWLDPLALAAVRKQRGEGAQVWLDGAIAAKVAEVNAQVARFESIKRWHVFEQPLTVESGLLTPTFKVKRKAVWAAFRNTFEALYDAAQQSSAAPANGVA
jgi:long-chain acyl-CoA synthetase